MAVKCLIVVDVQRDFCPGGALPAAEGNDIVPVINSLMDKFDYVIATKDWHPSQTVHFEKWPVHCVRGSDGARFHEQLNIDKINEVVLKGTGNTDDGYSGFEGTNVDMSSWLRRNNVTDVHVCGIATEYCVLATATDALKGGFNTTVITNAIAAVEAQPGDKEKALKTLEETGIRLVDAEQV